MSRPIVRLPVIGATSPTRAESMRACMLRAGLSRAQAVSAFVLGNPKAWLGTAYHEVLEKLAGVDLQTESVEAAVERLWTAAIASQHQRMLSHPLDRRFGAPTTWPGYYVTRASADLRARGIASARPAGSHAAGAATPPSAPAATIREEEFKAFDGKLLGRPDVIQDGDVVDYKTGAIVEYDEIAQADVVKAAYVRQLRIYGYLAKQSLGSWPRRGVLLPAVGEGVEVPLNPTDCEAEARGAVALLDEYNARATMASSVRDLAAPSPEACKWCSQKLVCEPFWESAVASWSGQLDGAAIEGDLVGAPEKVQGGSAYAFSLCVVAGSEERKLVRVAPLNPSTHDRVAALVAGERVRITGLRARPDGVLVPTPRTIIRPLREIPDVQPAGGP